MQPHSRCAGRRLATSAVLLCLVLLGSRAASAQTTVQGATLTSFFALPQCRALDTRLSPDGPALAVGPERVVSLQGRCNIPADAVAVSINVAAFGSAGGGELVILPGDQAATGPLPPAVAYQNGAVRSASAIRTVSTDGHVSLGFIAAGSPGDAVTVVVDVNGYFSGLGTPAPTANGPLTYRPVPQCRLADTRRYGGALTGNGATRSFAVKGLCGIPNDAQVGVFTLSAVQPTAVGYMKLGASDQVLGTVSTMTLDTFDAVRSEGALTGLGPSPNDVALGYTGFPAASTVQAVLDTSGYFTTQAQLGYIPLAKSCRVMDTRTSGALPLNGTSRSISVKAACPAISSSASAVAATVTVLHPSSQGFLRLFRSDASLPTATTISYSQAVTEVSNGVIVELGAASTGDLNVWAMANTGTADVVIDVLGYFNYFPVAVSQGGGDLAPATPDDENVGKGFRPDKAYHFNDVDHINLFNGNLVVAIPLGQSYPVGPDLSFSLSLVYNSNQWHYDTGAGGTTVGDPQMTWPVPDIPFNAGLGWQVTLGQLYGPSKLGNDQIYTEYVGPDGAHHPFFDTLHAGDTATPGVQYTRDGSYLRKTSIPTGGDTIEFPDGQIHTFNADGKPILLADRFGNGIMIDYDNPINPATGQPSCGTTASSCWVITDTVRRQAGDTTGRRHVVYFKLLTNSPETVDRIELMGFRGMESPAQGPNVIQFVYGTPGAETYNVLKPCPNSLATDPAMVSVRMPLLQQVVLSDNSHWDMSGYILPTPQVGQCGVAGVFQTLGVPTGGQISWTYGIWRLPGSQRVSGSLGVKTRSAGGGTWHYDQTFFSEIPPAQGSYPTTSQTTVTDPLGNQTVNYFSVYGRRGQGTPPNFDLCVNGDPQNCWQRAEYGLPVRHSVALTSGSNYFFLTRQVIPAGTTSAVRESYSAYEHDVLDDAWAVYEIQKTSLNHRVVRERTLFLDDCAVGSAGSCTQSRFADTLRSTFDGLGHYKQTTTDGNFNGSNARTDYVDYNSCSLHGCSRGVPNPSEAWLLGTFDYRQSSGDGTSTYAAYSFNGGTGFLNNHSVHLSGTSGSGAGDVTTTYLTDGQGFVAAEIHSGGDTGQTSTVNHFHLCGALTRSTYVGATFNSEDYTIDCASGLVRESRDTAGIKTVFNYDPMGRLTGELRDNEATKSYGYVLPTTTHYAAPHISTSLQDPSTQAVFAETEVDFDGLGRPIEHRKLRGGQWDRQQTVYDIAGNVIKQSTWYSGQAGGPVGWTVFDGLDAFGRATAVYAPDYQASPLHGKTTLSYSGVGVKTQTTYVGRRRNTSGGVIEDPTTTSWQYDRFGRLAQVTEPSADQLQCLPTNPGPCNVTTSYAYDVQGHLTQAATPSVNPTQVRQFHYDPRGFVSWEMHPEKSTNLVGTHDVDYQRYDALGHAGRRTEGANDMYFDYNSAGQLTDAWEDAAKTRHVLKYTYGNVFGNNGKVTESRRYNMRRVNGGLTQAVLYQAYSYNGLGGRPDSRVTRLSVNAFDPANPENLAPPNETFLTQFTYNVLGRTAAVTYPQCLFPASGSTPSACLDGQASSPADRTIGYCYADGLLTGVFDASGGSGGSAGLACPSSLLASLAYSPSGLVSSVVRSNGVTDFILPDPTGIARTAGIQVVSAGGTAQLAPYSYDTSGNVIGIGTGPGQPSDSFTYDLVNRIHDYHATDGTTQGFSHDVFGNLQSIATNATLRATPTDPSTNHLTAATYDAAGNMTDWSGQHLEYDSLGAVASIDSASSTPCGDAGAPSTSCWFHIYDADGERVWSVQLGSNRLDRWTIRDLEGRVLREFDATQYQGWANAEDYIYRGSEVLASVTPAAGMIQLHLDHLGTPRLRTTASGQSAGYYAYTPFGEQLSPIDNPPSAKDLERIRFTGHERDLGDPRSTADDWDYMHARYYRALLGRFASPDPAGGNPSAPQSWNLYTYAANNPVSLTDPNGRYPYPHWFDMILGGTAGINGLVSGIAGMAAPAGFATAPVALGTLSITAALATGLGFFYFTNQISDGVDELTGDHNLLEKIFFPSLGFGYANWENSLGNFGADSTIHVINRDLGEAKRISAAMTQTAIGLKSQIAHTASAMDRAYLQQRLDEVQYQIKNLKEKEAQLEKMKKAWAKMHGHPQSKSPTNAPNPT
jgi:RHS repeat-associated protein